MKILSLTKTTENNLCWNGWFSGNSLVPENSRGRVLTCRSLSEGEASWIQSVKHLQGPTLGQSAFVFGSCH